MSEHDKYIDYDVIYKAELAKVKQQLAIAEKKYARALWWLNEIVNNHRFTPISTAEKAIKELEK